MELKDKMRVGVVLVGSMLLVGCNLWASPLFGNDGESIRVLNSPPDDGSGSGPAFSITARASLDPRSKADAYCYELMRFSRLTEARRNAAADPNDDTITWYFLCVR